MPFIQSIGFSKESAIFGISEEYIRIENLYFLASLSFELMTHASIILRCTLI